MKELVIYFSRADENYGVGNIKVGNTELIANEIQKIRNADIFKCKPAIPYSKNYSKCCDEAKEYQESNARPKLKEYISDISKYVIIYIGGPVYWGEYPYELYSQLDILDFTNKIIKPFTTHKGSGLGDCVEALQRHCKGTLIKEGLAIQCRKVNSLETKNRLQNWLLK